MPLNSFTCGLTFQDLNEFCGPDDLRDAIISIRKSGAFATPISDQGIRRLIKLVYYASLAPEEGRFPRSRFIVRKPGTGDVFIAGHFEVELKDIDTLRRLAPAVSGSDGALL